MLDREKVHSLVIEPSIMRMLSRFKAEYGFINTKFNIATEEDFFEEDSFRGKSHVYNWIQGRGLEAIAKHILYFRSIGEKDTAERLYAMLSVVVKNTEAARSGNGGRLPFVMSPEGQSMSEIYPEANFTDLFYGKGLFAAANVLEDKALASEAAKLYALAVRKIGFQLFRTDQKSFDPKNPVEYVPGKFPQGPRMISLSGLADLALAGNGEAQWLDIAATFIAFVFQFHVNQGQLGDNLQIFDFVETIDAESKPRMEGDKLLCDPGHALEFVGLAGKCLLAMRKLGVHADLIEKSRGILPELFRHTFDFGFQKGPGGIVKAYDLISRTPSNSDMPWWSLPETIRAGIELQDLFPNEAQGVEERIQLAWQAFSGRFLQKNGFACQTRDEKGEIVNVIPALPDAYPGYHTNLSLLDCLA